MLDMRNNPGGLIDEAEAVADEFLSGGVIYTTRHRGKVRRGGPRPPRGALSRLPVVVLVNEYSASSAELVAGALQDRRARPVVGAPTFGKGSVQTIFQLPGGAGLRLTTMRYYTPGGQRSRPPAFQPSVLIKAAYAADRSFGVVREADLEGHLPTEGSRHEKVGSRRRTRDGSPMPNAPDPKEAEGQTHLGVAREIPNDPTGGPISNSASPTRS